MKLSKIIELLNGKLLTDPGIEQKDIAGAMGADLMSDVLASIQPEAALLTGLCNPQVVRTALIADIRAIIFVRGKNPAREAIDLANEEGIPLVTTKSVCLILRHPLHAVCPAWKQSRRLFRLKEPMATRSPIITDQAAEKSQR